MVAIYARQSVFRAESLSIEDQINKCGALVLSTESSRVFQDAGYSGKNTARPAFEEMLDGIKKGSIHKVIAYRLDRISRSISDFCELMKLLDRYDVAFQTDADHLSYTPGQKDDFGKMLMQILMVFAEFERRTIQSRVMENYFARARTGKSYLGGYAPFGYEKIGKGDKSYLEVDKEKAGLLREIFEDYADPNLCKSIGKLARQLNEEGVLTARNDRWTGSSLGRILRSPVYVQADVEVYRYLKSRCKAIHNDEDDFIGNTNGFYVFARQEERNEDEQRQYRKKKAGRTAANLENAELVLAPHQGIIPPDLWLAAQDKLANNKQVKCDRSGTHSWLTGLIKCGCCHTGLYVVNNNHGKNYVNCYGRKKGVCTAKKGGILLEDVEREAEVALFAVLGLLRDVKAIEQTEENAAVKRLKAERNKLEDERREIHAAMQELTRHKRRDAVVALAGDYDAVSDKLRRLDDEISAEQFKAARKNIPAIDADTVRSEWKGYDIEQKRIVARVFLDKVIVLANPAKREGGGSALVEVIANAAL